VVTVPLTCWCELCAGNAPMVVQVLGFSNYLRMPPVAPDDAASIPPGLQVPDGWVLLPASATADMRCYCPIHADQAPAT
jgi:hypothetical protein